MRKLNIEVFSGLSAGEKMVKFINENNIQQKDILKIIDFNGLQLFYYSEK